MPTKIISSSQRSEIAQKAQVSEQYLYQCLTGRRDMKAKEAVRIERVTGIGGLRFQLCQREGKDIWPELAQAPAESAQPAIETVAGQGA